MQSRDVNAAMQLAEVSWKRDKTRNILISMISMAKKQWKSSLILVLNIKLLNITCCITISHILHMFHNKATPITELKLVLNVSCIFYMYKIIHMSILHINLYY